MTNTIDWDKPLEAYHPDGRVVDVELDCVLDGAGTLPTDIMNRIDAALARLDQGEG